VKIALGLEYPLRLRGGVSVLVETLAQGFLKEGHEVWIISPDRTSPFAGTVLEGAKVSHLHWSKEIRSRAHARQFAEMVSKARPDIVHLHYGGVFGFGSRVPGGSPAIYLNARGIACFSTSHLVVDFFEGYCGPQKPFWFKVALWPFVWLAKILHLRAVRKEIAVSQHDYKKLTKRFVPYGDKFVQIYHSRLPAEEAEISPMPQRPAHVLTVGHVAWRKGQAWLAEAFAQVADRHPEWKLYIAGHYSPEGAVERIRELARERNLEDRIVLLGERSDAMELMKSAAIYVQPAFFEALGLALQEAVFTGCAVIGSDAGGIPELIDHERTGLLVPSGDTAALAAALERLMDDPALREKFSQAGPALLTQKGMSAPMMVEKHLALYESARKS